MVQTIKIYIATLFVTLALFSCVGKQAPKPVVTTQTDSSALEYPRPVFNVPANCNEDSIVYIVKPLNLRIAAYFFYSKDTTQALYRTLTEKMLRKEIQDLKNDAVSNYKENPPDSGDAASTFDAIPQTYYEDSSIISTCYAITTFTTGADHAYEYFRSVNFNKHSHQLFAEADYFNIVGAADSAKVIALISPHLKDEADEQYDIPTASDSDEEGAPVDQPLKSMDIAIEGDSIRCGFADFALGEDAVLHATIAKKDLINWIKPAYK